MGAKPDDIDIGNGYSLRRASHGGGCYVVKDGHVMRGENRQPLWFSSISKAIGWAIADWEIKRWSALRDEALLP